MKRSFWTEAALLVALLFVFSVSAFAQTPSGKRCAPMEDVEGRFGQVIDYSLSSTEGPYMAWDCYELISGQWRLVSAHCIEAVWSELPLNAIGALGGRAETIRKSADPVKAFNDSYTRHVKRASPRCLALLNSYK